VQEDMNRFPAALARKMFWSTQVGGTSVCPECAAGLEAEHHAYAMVIREGQDMQPFVVGNNAGHFCPKCPTVVLDHEEFNECASAAADGPRAAFVVLGLVDFDAIPKDKEHVPLGDDDNPLPLVKFTNLGDSASGAKLSGGEGRKRKSKKHRKKRR
jgi:hypothetical protein